MESHTPTHTAHEKAHCCSCDGCNWGMGGHMRRHSPLRMLLVILGALVIFWIGFKLGILKGYVMSGSMQGSYGQMERGDMMYTRHDMRTEDPAMMTVPAGAPTPAIPAVQ